MFVPNNRAQLRNSETTCPQLPSTFVLEHVIHIFNFIQIIDGELQPSVKDRGPAGPKGEREYIVIHLQMVAQPMAMY